MNNSQRQQQLHHRRRFHQQLLLSDSKRDLEAQESTYLFAASIRRSDLSSPHSTYRSFASRSGSQGSSDNDDEASWTEEKGEHATNKEEEGEEEEAPLIEEIQHIREVLGEHLLEAEEGEDFLLEVSLTRSLSLLPTKDDVSCVAEGFSDMGNPFPPSITNSEHQDSMEPDEKLQEVKTSNSTPLHAYLCLACAIVAMSSIGPFLNCIEGVEPTMKILWRNVGTALLLAPMAVRSLCLVDGPPQLLTHAQWLSFVVAAASYCLFTVCYAMSLEYTSVGNATILANSQSILLVLAKCLSPHPAVILWEVVGVIVAFTGAALCSQDASSLSTSLDGAMMTASSSASWDGDMLALLSALGGIGYITMGKALRSHMDAFVFMFLIMVTTSIMMLLYMWWCTEEEITFDRHIDHGVWGWLNMRYDRLPMEIVVVVVCNVVGTLGYVQAFAYFSSVILTVAALLQPVIATVIAVAMQVGSFPGSMGWAGNVMVVLGTLCVMHPAFQKTAESFDLPERKRVPV